MWARGRGCSEAKHAAAAPPSMRETLTTRLRTHSSEGFPSLGNGTTMKARGTENQRPCHRQPWAAHPNPAGSPRLNHPSHWTFGQGHRWGPVPVVGKDTWRVLGLKALVWQGTSKLESSSPLMNPSASPAGCEHGHPRTAACKQQEPRPRHRRWPHHSQFWDPDQVDTLLSPFQVSWCPRGQRGLHGLARRRLRGSLSPLSAALQPHSAKQKRGLTLQAAPGDPRGLPCFHSLKSFVNQDKIHEGQASWATLTAYKDVKKKSQF